MLPLRSPPRTQVDYNLKYAHKMYLKPAVCHHIHKKNCPSNIRLATSDYRQHGNLLAVTCARSASLSQTIAKLSVLTMNVQFIIVINHFTPRKKQPLNVIISRPSKCWPWIWLNRVKKRLKSRVLLGYLKSVAIDHGNITISLMDELSVGGQDRSMILNAVAYFLP